MTLNDDLTKINRKCVFRQVHIISSMQLFRNPTRNITAAIDTRFRLSMKTGRTRSKKFLQDDLRAHYARA